MYDIVNVKDMNFFFSKNVPLQMDKVYTFNVIEKRFFLGRRHIKTNYTLK